MAYFPVPWQRTEGLMLADTKLQSSRNKSSRENKKKTAIMNMMRYTTYLLKTHKSKLPERPA